jgi:transglutaminase-like putative cysteine protease
VDGVNSRVWPLLAAAILVGASTSVFLLALSEGKADVYAITTMAVRYDVVVTNAGPGDAEGIPLTVAYTRDSEPNQHVKSIEVSPAPNRTYVDSLGNRFAVFVIDRLLAGSNFTVTFNAVVELKNMDINIRPGAGGTYAGEEDAFLQPTSFADSADPVVVAKARALQAASGDVYETVWNIYSFIVDGIAYQQLPGEWPASWVLEHGEGGSAELGNVFVALARASGIPARRLSGWGEPFNVSETRTVNRFAHGWAEFYMPGYGWVPADPTFGKTHRFDNLARPDDQHVVMTKGEGIHFFDRGAYAAPSGDASVSTDYRVTPLAKETVTVSTEHFIVLGFLYGLPLFLVAAAALKIHAQRRAAGRAGGDDFDGG